MHATVKIFWFIQVLLMLSFFNQMLLFVLFVLICVVTSVLYRQRFWHLIKRMRVFFISIFLVYAFSTPGEYISNTAAFVSPTYEGIGAGAVQIAHLVIILAALCLLFASSNKESLMAGLYYFLSPLRKLGLDVRCFIVRLFLTFNEVDKLTSIERKFDLLTFIQSLKHVHHHVYPHAITLSLPRLTMKDYGYILVSLFISIAAFLASK